MSQSTAEYLIQLYQAEQQEILERANQKPWKDRPKTIVIPGAEILIERDTTNPRYQVQDQVAIVTSKDMHVLNDIIDEDIYLFDSGKPSVSVSYINGKPEFLVGYSSHELIKSRKNLYCFLHELFHISDWYKGDMWKPDIEAAAWDKAAAFLKDIGLDLFESEEEMALYRDVSLRSYDLEGKHGVIKSGLMTQLHSLDIEVVYGLAAAARSGLCLKELCTRLIEEVGQDN